MTPKRLFIVDAMAMAFRTFHAFGARPISRSDGLPTSAVFGSAQFLLKLLSDERPDYFAIALDAKGPTFRHDLYPDYKGNRPEMPEDLAVQLPYLQRLYQALGCPLIIKQGVEADDLIGTIVKNYSSDSLHSYIVSGDKDFMQLINKNVFLYRPMQKGEVQLIDHEGVCAKFGCAPEQVIDALALMGDSSDNVPGVRGIGQKGAEKLLQTYGSLDAIYENLERITNKRQKNGLAENRDMAYLSRQLVTIKCDIEEIPSLDELVCNCASAIANEELRAFFEELEFRRLTDRVTDAIKQLATTPAASQVTQPEQLEYRLISTPALYEEVLSELKSVSTFSWDTETTGLDLIADRPIGMSVSWGAGKAAYLPLHEKHLQELSVDQARQMASDILALPARKVAHNLKFDLQMMTNFGVEVKAPWGDTMIASHLLAAESRSHGLDALSLQHCGVTKVPTSDLIGKDGSISMLDVPLDTLTHYACEDADMTLRLHECFEQQLRERQLWQAYEEVEVPLVPVLALMEQRGVYIDTQVLADFAIKLTAMIEQMEQKVYELAGEKFNISSPKQLQVILFEKLKLHETLGLKRLKKTKSGYSTDVTVLEQLSAHPLPAAILEFRGAMKLKNTYVEPLAKMVKPTTQRLHSRFHQTITATGRLSSSEPNLQNIPIRSTLGKEVRKAFRPQSKDTVLVSADYSQIELRILAHMSKDPGLMEAFQQNQDIHRSTAAKIFGVEPDLVDADMRSRAKAINFGIIYGMGPARLARETGVSFKEAKAFIDRYFEGFPKIKEFVASCLQQAEQHHETRTITGRTRPLGGATGRSARLENIAVNTPIQGSAADLIKLAMIKIEREFSNSGLGARMVLQVHDELVFECPRSEVEKAKEIIRATMESALPLDVPIKVEVGVGESWLAAH